MRRLIDRLTVGALSHGTREYCPLRASAFRVSFERPFALRRRDDGWSAQEDSDLRALRVLVQKIKSGERFIPRSSSRRRSRKRRATEEIAVL